MPFGKGGAQTLPSNESLGGGHGGKEQRQARSPVPFCHRNSCARSRCRRASESISNGFGRPSARRNQNHFHVVQIFASKARHLCFRPGLSPGGEAGRDRATDGCFR